MTEAVLSRPRLDLEATLAGALELARRAGEAINEIYATGDFGVVQKADDSPLTRADLASHEILVAGLAELTPGIPVLSEESAETAYEERRAWSRLWLVDPLDGTKEFVKRNGEFTVNLALIEDGDPILGVVHAPDLGSTYWGVVGRGAWRQDGDAAPSELLAGGSGGDRLRIVASRSHPSPDLEIYLGQLSEHELVAKGSSLKLCLVAEGAADLYPRLGPTMEWDTAAGQGVVLAAGGRVVRRNGQPLRYNKESLLNPHFIVLAEGFEPSGQRSTLTES